MKCLVVALDAEARPLLDRYGLRADRTAKGFRVYRAAATALIVSGVGRIASAAATAYLQAYLGQAQAHAWLNIGIAGHAHRPLGHACIAHKIVAAHAGQSWYPPPVVHELCESATLLTVDRPLDGYPDDALVDMEAAGFYPTACRFASAELVQVLKVISDNSAHPASELSAPEVIDLIAARLDTVDAVLQALAGLADELAGLSAEPIAYRELIARLRASESQRRRLRDLLRRWQVVCPGQALPSFDDVKQALRWLERQIALPGPGP